MNNPFNQTLQPYPKFYKFALALSVFLFLCTFSYWFIDPDSPLSVINILFNKTGPRPEMLRYYSPEQLAAASYHYYYRSLWPIFYTHLAVTVFALFIYYQSKFTHWLGAVLSHQHFIAKFFFASNKTATALTYLIKGLVGLVMVFFLYRVVIEMTKGEDVPRQLFGSFILLFIAGTAIWHVSFPEPVEKKGFTGSLDNRNQVTWIRLADNQVAYVQNRSNKNLWKFYQSRSDVDFSFTEGYIFMLDKFSHRLPSVEAVTTSVGNIVCGFDMEYIIENFPSELSFELVKKLMLFTESSYITNVIFQAINQSKVKNSIQKNYNELNTYFQDNPRVPKQEWDRKYNQINEKISSLNMDIAIGEAVENSVNQQFIKHSDKGAFFKIVCTIKRDSARAHFDNVIGKHIEEYAKKDIEDMRHEKELILTALISKLGTPGLPVKQSLEYMEMIQEVRNNDINTASLDRMRSKLNLSQNNNTPQLGNALNEASIKIAQAIFYGRKQNQDPLFLKEVISNSTDFLQEKNISFERFFEKLSQKWENEKEERTEEAYQSLVKDTLQSFLQETTN